MALEKELQFFEGNYARIIREVESGENYRQPNAEDLNFLCLFMWLQARRTQVAQERVKKIRIDMAQAVAKGFPFTPPELPTDKEIIMESMLAFVTSVKNIEDLNTILIRALRDFVWVIF